MRSNQFLRYILVSGSPSVEEIVGRQHEIIMMYFGHHLVGSYNAEARTLHISCTDEENR